MKIISLIAIVFFPLISLAQRNVSDSIISSPYFAIRYGTAWTSADLSDRYGYMNNLGILAGYKTNRNWFFGLDGGYLFGNRIYMDDPFINLRDSKGNITDQNGDIATVLTFSRGWQFDLNVGKIIPILSPNVNSGIFVQFGAGYLQHKMRIETNDHVVPVLELDYKKGYDRFTSGVNLRQFLGYSFMANQGFYNFYAGFYISEGFTKNRRTVFFDQPDIPVSNNTRMDIMYGFQAGWIIPIYQRKPKDFYYN